MYQINESQKLHLITCVGPEFHPRDTASLHVWADHFEIPLVVLGMNDKRISKTGFFSGYRLLLLREYLLADSRSIPSRSKMIRQHQNYLAFDFQPTSIAYSQRTTKKEKEKTKEKKEFGFEKRTIIRDSALILFVSNPRNLAFNHSVSLDHLVAEYEKCRKLSRPESDLIFAGSYELPEEIANHTEFFSGKSLQRRLAFVDSNMWMGSAESVKHYLSSYAFDYRTNDQLWWNFRLMEQENSSLKQEGGYDGSANSPFLDVKWCRNQIKESKKETKETTPYRISVDHDANLLMVAGSENTREQKVLSNWIWNKETLEWGVVLSGIHTNQILRRLFQETNQVKNPCLVSRQIPSKGSNEIWAKLAKRDQIPFVSFALNKAKANEDDSGEEWWWFGSAIVLGVLFVVFLILFLVYYVYYENERKKTSAKVVQLE